MADGAAGRQEPSVFHYSDPFIRAAREDYDKMADPVAWDVWLEIRAFSRIEEALACYEYLLDKELGGDSWAENRRLAVCQIQATAAELDMGLPHDTSPADPADHEGHEAYVAQLGAMPYNDYLASAEWAAQRRVALRRAGFRCQSCNRGGVQLHVHHRTYERRGDEALDDLLVLCADCHSAVHEYGGWRRAKVDR